MTASSDIHAIAPNTDYDYERSDRYEWGFKDAKRKAARAAHEHDMLAARMAGALAGIDLEDPGIVEALGINTTFNIGTALRMYREQQAK